MSPMCEKCWADAYGRAMDDTNKTQSDHYQELLDERKDSPCAPEQQNGEYQNEDDPAQGGESDE